MDKAKAMIEADPNRSYVVDVFEAGSNQKVSFKSYRPHFHGSIFFRITARNFIFTFYFILFYI